MADSPEMVQPAPADLQEAAPEPPKRRGRPPGSKNKTTRRGRPRKSLEQQIGGVLAMANFMFAFMPREFQGDALDNLEIVALSRALNDAARENETLYKYLDAALGGSGSAMLNLGILGVCIAGRRLARHEIIGRDWDDRMGAFIGASVGDASQVDFTQMFANTNGTSEASD